MSAGRRTLAQRLLSGVVRAVGDRAPGLSDHAYRVVAAPLQWVDPAGGARAAQARLDDLRDRVAVMAARGRVGRGEPRRIQRDLARTREDLQRLAPRLPALQSRALAVRLAAYTEVLGALSGGAVDRTRPVRGWDALVLTGAAGVGAGVLFPVAGVTAAAEGGLVAGAVTALGVAALRHGQARRARLVAVAEALGQVDLATRGPHGVSLQQLDQDHRALSRRARSSGRLDERGVRLLDRIDALLDDLLVRLLEGDLEVDVSHLVRATVTDYLPDTLEPLLALTDPRTLVGGRPAAVEVADQLARIESGLAEAARRPARHHPETLLLLQGEFLRSKFGHPPQ
ncbi:MAG TPA: hypothetical protein VFP72_14000 [Kineosporiaceae bacterium]|nr:hypothetical protein [Kineosporiaceae bacterium]